MVFMKLSYPHFFSLPPKKILIVREQLYVGTYVYVYCARFTHLALPNKGAARFRRSK